MNKDEAKKKIQQLIEKYEKVVTSGLLKRYTEEETKKDFILPLFEAVGWSVFDKHEVSAEEYQASGKRVDYGFYLNDRIKFFLEAKALSENLHNEDYAKQAIKYSWNKGVAWAILTDFESIKVFNAQILSPNLADRLFFEIPYRDYVPRFDQLWLLSKEAFSQNLLDLEAAKYGKKLLKVSVSNLLYKDLNECRELLTENLNQWNKGLNRDLLDKGVQKLLDRLIFLRVAEDRGIESQTLLPLVREWNSRTDKGKLPLYKFMVSKFRELDEVYNSNLFSPHPFEDWDEYSNATEKAIKILYGKQGYYEYDFKAIPSDVLGTVYENYLGYRLSQSRKKITINKDATKRKEQGIYYTPSYIVDYIVKNTLQPVLDKCSGVEDLKKIKVLDPACGSGSFLIKALEMITQKYKDFGYKDEEMLKIMILSENIYGVDLDEQAVEIARLNLLISTLTQRIKLPKLDHIKNGNSLISGSDEELKKYFGSNFRDKKPFNWEEQFPEVFKQGGFDVILGNPPYGADLSDEEQFFYNFKFNLSTTDSAALFINNFYNLLNSKGKLGFIIPKAFCYASNWEKIRKILWKNIEALIDCHKAWSEVKLEQVIIIASKFLKKNNYESGVIKDEHVILLGNIDWLISADFGFLLNGVSEEEINIAQKINSTKNIRLGSIVKNQRGGMLQNKLSEIGDTEVIGGINLSRRGIVGIKGRINKAEIQDKNAFVQKPSILVQNIVAHIENPSDHIKITAILANEANQAILDTINQIVITNKDYSEKYICALLNSNLINWYVYRFVFGKAIRTMHFDNYATGKIPIVKISKQEQMPIIYLMEKLENLNKDINKETENSNKWLAYKEEIEKTNKKIDEEVYKLYGLTKEEIEVVEGNSN